MDKSISVIIPTKNGGDLFRKSLQMILSQEIDFPFEIIVVDSGSTDQTLQLCTKYPVRLIQIPASSFNHSSTRNLAISMAQGDICVLTVQDAVPVDRKWLAKLVKPLMKNDRVAGVFGQQVSRDDAFSLSKCCKLLWYQEWRNNWQQEYEQLPVEPYEWHTFSSEQKKEYARFDNVNSCIRKSVWQKIPFPDVAYAEDVAWAIKALTSGFSIFWQPNARVFHSHERSLAYEFRRSYVDMKSISAILGDSPVKMTRQMAWVVIEWLAQETYRFLQRPAENCKGGKYHIGMMTEADSLWQRLSREPDSKERGEEEPLVSVFTPSENIRNALLHYLFLIFAGPEWFRKRCRRFFNKGLFRQKMQGHTSTAPLFLMEIQARHRFFLNQLLQIYFTQNCKTLHSARCIRLGAAVMVGGSILGQHMRAVEYTGRRVDELGADKTQYATNAGEFWQTLATWHTQENRREDKILTNLDQLMTGGV